MTICSPSLRVNCIPICTGTLYVGELETQTERNVNVYIKNITTSRVELIIGSVDEFGIVSVDISDYTFSDNHTFELYVTETDSQTKLNITIGESTNTLIGLCFEDVEARLAAYYITEVILTEA